MVHHVLPFSMARFGQQDLNAGIPHQGQFVPLSEKRTFYEEQSVSSLKDY